MVVMPDHSEHPSNTKQMLRSILVVTILAAFCGCANMQPVATPTGKPEVTIGTTNTSSIKSALVSDLAANGYRLSQDTAYSMVFTRPLEGGSALLYQAALGNSYSSTPQMNISFSFAPQSGATRVFARIYTTMQNAFGRVDQTNMDRGRAAHDVQAMLERVKSRFGERGRDLITPAVTTPVARQQPYVRPTGTNRFLENY
jgi:hypothetical protein